MNLEGRQPFQGGKGQGRPLRLDTTPFWGWVIGTQIKPRAKTRSTAAAGGSAKALRRVTLV
jgi:hypothetical protein